MIVSKIFQFFNNNFKAITGLGLMLYPRSLVKYKVIKYKITYNKHS